jgi:hypothetical protein
VLERCGQSPACPLDSIHLSLHIMKQIFSHPRTGPSSLWSWDPSAAFAKIKVLAPYAAMELILPGGSVMAILLWLYRRRKNSGVLAEARARHGSRCGRKSVEMHSNTHEEHLFC